MFYYTVLCKFDHQNLQCSNGWYNSLELFYYFECETSQEGNSLTRFAWQVETYQQLEVGFQRLIWRPESSSERFTTCFFPMCKYKAIRLQRNFPVDSVLNYCLLKAQRFAGEWSVGLTGRSITRKIQDNCQKRPWMWPWPTRFSIACMLTEISSLVQSCKSIEAPSCQITTLNLNYNASIR